MALIKKLSDLLTNTCKLLSIPDEKVINISLFKLEDEAAIFEFYDKIVLMRILIKEYKHYKKNKLLYSKYKKDYKALHIKSSLLDMLKSYIASNKGIKYLRTYMDNIQNIVYANINSVKLYKLFVLHILTIYTKFQSAIMCYVNNMQKYVMLYEIKTENNSKELYANNPHLNMFGLTSNKEIISITEVFDGITNIQGLPAYSKKNNILIIIINQIVKNPIIYKDIVTDIDKTAGISSKLIKEYSYMNYLKSGNKWDFDINQYGTLNDDSKIIVLQSIMPNKYRIMCNTLQNNKCSKYVDRCKIEPLLDFIKNKNVYKSNTCESLYNKYNEDTMLQNIFNPIKHDISKMHKNTKENKYVISFDIINDIMEVIKDIIPLESTYDIKHMYNIIHNEKILDVFSKVLLDNYKKLLDTEYNAEITTSILYNINALNKDFRRMLYDMSSTIFILDEINKMSICDKNKYFLDYIYKIMESVVKKILLLENNIYDDIIYKNILLEIS
jgi:hypothetical protein